MINVVILGALCFVATRFLLYGVTTCNSLKLKLNRNIKVYAVHLLRQGNGTRNSAADLPRSIQIVMRPLSSHDFMLDQRCPKYASIQ
jgi:hypothetical protein